MDTFTKPEMLLSGSAILLVGGSTWYLNSRINTFEETLHQLTDRFATMVSRIHQHDDDVKITKSKLTDIESFSNHLKRIQDEFKELKESLNDEFRNIEDLMNKQNKKVLKVNQRVDLLYQHLGVNVQPEPELVHPGHSQHLGYSQQAMYTNEDMGLSINAPPSNQELAPIKKKKIKNNKRSVLNGFQLNKSISTNIDMSKDTVKDTAKDMAKDKDKYLEENVLEEMATLGLQ